MERFRLFSLDAAKMEAQAENDKRGPSPASSRYCKLKPEREPPHRVIIPDITNKTSFNQHSQLKSRMRGEQVASYDIQHWVKGSSPRTRGTVNHRMSQGHAHGIIPACAGNSDARATRFALRRNHPRVRGEQSDLAPHQIAGRGSSPHARGTARLRPHPFRVHGIIPACAGNRR